MATRKRTVLIVDDEAGQRAWMRGVLRQNGYAVLEAADYTEALSVKDGQAEVIDMFVIDIRLPGGSGYDLSLELVAGSPASKILFVSGTAGAELCKYFTTPLQTVQFLQKPFDAEQLIGRVRDLFGDSAEVQITNASANMPMPSAVSHVRASCRPLKRPGKC